MSKKKNSVTGMTFKKAIKKSIVSSGTQPTQALTPVQEAQATTLAGNARTKTNTSQAGRARGFLATQANTIRKRLLGE